MSTYISLIIFLIVTTIIEVTLSKKNNINSTRNIEQVLFLVVVFVVTYISAIRFDVGADCLSYYNDYHGLKDGNTLGMQYYEPGFLYLCKFLGVFFEEPQWLIVTTSIIILGFISSEIKRISRYPIFSMFCFVTFYFYFISMNITRQYMALGFVFWGQRFLLEPIKYGKIKFTIVCLLSLLLHSTGIVGLLILLAKNLKQTQKIKILVIVSFVVLYFSTNIMSSILLAIFPFYADYFDYGRSGNSDSSIIILIAILILCWILEKDARKKILNYDFYLNCIVFGIYLNILASINIMFSRVGIYFTINLIVFLPMMVYALKNGSFYRLIIIVVSIVYCLWNLGNNNAGVVPYNSFF